MGAITESEQQALEDGLDTPSIMRAVESISRLRAELAVDESPAIRDELLELHRLALTVRERGTEEQLSELFDLANDLELQVGEWMEALSEIQATLSAMTVLYPESLAYGEG